MKTPAGGGLHFLASLTRLEPNPNLLNQLGRLGEPVRLLERKHNRVVDRDIIYAVVARDQSKRRQRPTEFLQNRVRVLDRLGKIAARGAISNRDFRHPFQGRGPSDKKVRRRLTGTGCRRDRARRRRRNHGRSSGSTAAATRAIGSRASSAQAGRPSPRRGSTRRPSGRIRGGCTPGG